VDQNSILTLSPEPSDGGNWSWTGAGTSGTSREQFVNTEIPGIFKANAIYTNPCGVPSRLSVVIEILDPVTGIKRSNIENVFVKIYPNPAENSITIKEITGYGNLSIRNGIIANMYGQTILTLNSMPSGPDNKIDISRLNAGTYFLKADSDRGILVARFVKLR